MGAPETDVPRALGVCFGTEVDPHAGRLQLIDSTLNSVFREGYQSAPIGTPLKSNF
jgi:hypothetical protein